MYISGLVTGAMGMFLLAALWTLALMIRFSDLLWRERAKRIAAARPSRRVIIEDGFGNRHAAFEAETISMTDSGVAEPCAR